VHDVQSLLVLRVSACSMPCNYRCRAVCWYRTQCLISFWVMKHPYSLFVITLTNVHYF